MSNRERIHQIDARVLRLEALHDRTIVITGETSPKIMEEINDLMDEREILISQLYHQKETA